MQLDGHSRGVEQRPKPHGGLLTALENNQVSGLTIQASQAGQNPSETSRKAEPRSLDRQSGFPWELPRV